MSTILLGCIADDFTGATDLANNLVRAGMRTVQTIGVPTNDVQAPVDAVVVALKSRTVPKDEAIAHSLDALRWLQSQGAQQTYFKYCSTFDSTSDGNIGPVTEALLDALRSDFTIATPAFPDNSRLAIICLDIPPEYANHDHKVKAQFHNVKMLRGQPKEEVMPAYEGGPPPKGIVVIEFPDMNAARSFYGPDEYREARSLRHVPSKTRIVLGEGSADSGLAHRT